MRIGPTRIERPFLSDRFSGFAGFMHEHRAGEDESRHPEPEGMQGAKQASSPLDRDFTVLGTGLTREIEIRGQMNNRGDIRAKAPFNHGEGLDDAVVRGEITGDILHRGGRMRFAGPVQSCHSKFSRQPVRGSSADEPAASCHQHQLLRRGCLHATCAQQEQCRSAFR